MRLSLHVIGLTTALLLGVIAVNANPETRSIGFVSEPLNRAHLSDVVTAPSAAAPVTPPSAVTQAPAMATSVAVTPPTPVKPDNMEELKVTLSEVGKVLNEGFTATAQVISGLGNLATPIVSIAIGTAILGVSLVKIVWFLGKLMYTTGSIVVENAQSAHAYFTK